MDSYSQTGPIRTSNYTPVVDKYEVPHNDAEEVARIWREEIIPEAFYETVVQIRYTKGDDDVIRKRNRRNLEPNHQHQAAYFETRDVRAALSRFLAVETDLDGYSEVESVISSMDDNYFSDIPEEEYLDPDFDSFVVFGDLLISDPPEGLGEFNLIRADTTIRGRISRPSFVTMSDILETLDGEMSEHFRVLARRLVLNIPSPIEKDYDIALRTRKRMWDLYSQPTKSD